VSNFYKQLVIALQSVLPGIHYMVTYASTSFSNSAVQHKQREYCTSALRLLEMCTLEIVNACVLHHGIHVVITHVACGYYMHKFVVCT